MIMSMLLSAARRHAATRLAPDAESGIKHGEEKYNTLLPFLISKGDLP